MAINVIVLQSCPKDEMRMHFLNAWFVVRISRILYQLPISSSRFRSECYCLSRRLMQGFRENVRGTFQVLSLSWRLGERLYVLSLIIGGEAEAASSCRFLLA